MTQVIRIVLTALLTLSASMATRAQIFDFRYTQVPSDYYYPEIFYERRGGTEVLGLNDVGQFVGAFGQANGILGLPHGFVYGSKDAGVLFGDYPEARSPQGFRLGVIPGPIREDPSYRYLDLAPDVYPAPTNAQANRPQAINNAGVVVGSISQDWFISSTRTDGRRAFVYDTNTRELTFLSIAGAVSMEAVDINNRGQIVGNFKDAQNVWHGFRYTDGVYEVIDFDFYGGNTVVGGINDAGTIVGHCACIDDNSFILRDGIYESFRAGANYTVASDINNAEQIVGWLGPSGKRVGFLYENGVTTILDLNPNSGSSTYARTINNLGVIGGSLDGIGFFVNTSPVPEPATYLLIIAGIGFLASRSGRRSMHLSVG